MQKLKRSKLLLVAILILSIVTINGYTPDAKAASFASAKDTISDSDFDATGVTHTVTFEMGVRDLTQNEYIRVTLDGNIGVGSATSSCPSNTTASSTGNLFDCVVDSGQTLASTTQTMTISDTVNPSGPANSYDVTITAYTSAGVEIESSNMKIYIISDVYVTATVPATLTFTIEGLNAGTDVNGVSCTATTTATTTPFGTLSDTASSTVCQQLKVSTNATNGFSVTVQQSDELTSAAGANINSFNNAPDNTGSTTPVAWTGPTGTVGEDYTYGHMGITTEDATLSALDFSGSKYAGLNNTDPLEIFYNGGVANSTGDGIGVTQVAYTAEISALQEAGDYETYLTYIATPTY